MKTFYTNEEMEATQEKLEKIAINQLKDEEASLKLKIEELEELELYHICNTENLMTLKKDLKELYRQISNNQELQWLYYSNQLAKYKAK